MSVKVKQKMLKDLPLTFIDGDRSSRYPKRTEFQDNGIAFLNAESINQGYVNFKTANFISKEKFLSIKKGRCRSGDLILTTRGNGVGKAAFFSSNAIDALINAQLLIIRPDHNFINPRFLYYSFIDPRFQSQLKNFVSGSAQPQLPIQSLKNIELEFPTLSTQRKIAGILSAYDDLIENNTRRIEILEEMARMLYREWFVKFRFPVDGGKEGGEGGGDRPSNNHPVELVESELGLIPKGWEVKKLGDIAQEIRRSVKPEDLPSDTPYIGLEHLPRRSIALSEWGTVEQIQSTKLIFKKGEILFGKIRPYFHKVGVAPIDGVSSSDAIVIQPKDDKYFSLVLSCVSSGDFVAHATQTSQGTKMPRANWKVLIEYPVLIPPESIIDQFNNVIQDNISKIHNLIFKNINLRKTRDLLLPRLISGEIDVEELDINLGAAIND